MLLLFVLKKKKRKVCGEVMMKGHYWLSGLIVEKPTPPFPHNVPTNNNRMTLVVMMYLIIMSKFKLRISRKTDSINRAKGLLMHLTLHCLPV